MEIIKLKKVDTDYPRSNAYGGFAYDKLNINLDKYKFLLDQVNEILNFYNYYSGIFKKFPIYNKFNKLLGKSHRFKVLFKSKQNSILEQIDSKYIFDENGIILDKLDLVYACSIDDIHITISSIKKLISFIENNRNAFDTINKLNSSSSDNKKEIKKIITNIIKKIEYQNKSQMINLLFDLNYLDNISTPNLNVDENKKLIKFYNIDSMDNILQILNNKNISIDDQFIISKENMILNLDKNTAILITNNFPFLISSASKNSIEIKSHNENEEYNNRISQPFPISGDLTCNNTLIGVIDTFAKFSNGWENYVEIKNFQIPFDNQNLLDYDHGTWVTSIIVGNDIINEYFKDDLGIFKVKHFGVLCKEALELSYVMKKIEEIIDKTPEIKIWNLSIDVIGTINNNISDLGRFLDYIQERYDILIVISSGNHRTICAGADSMSAVTVGALYEDNNLKLKEAEYSRGRKILGRFEKPNTNDIGNDLKAQDRSENLLHMLGSDGMIEIFSEGTSFATPLITRKCAFLYEKYNMSIETIRSIINLQSKISELKGNTKRANVFFENINNNDEKIIWMEGEIEPKKTYSTTIILPHILKPHNKEYKIYRDYHMAISTAYKVNNLQKVGDEYSSIEITCKVISENVQESKGIKSVLKTESNTEQDVNATQHNLLKYFKKYDPNKVIIDIDLLKDKYKTPFKVKDDKLKITISCQDLFDNPNNKKIKYGISIFLKGMTPTSLDNFVNLNSSIIDSVMHNVKITSNIEIENINKKR